MTKEMLMEEQILELYAGLARETARCELHALRAVKDGRRELVPLFRSLGVSLSMQANRFMVQIRGTINSTDETLAEIYGSMLPASIAEYEQLADQADQLGSRALATGFAHCAKIQRKNASLYRQVTKDQRSSQYHVCDFCGYVSRDSLPGQCPICTAPKKRFQQVADR